MADIKLSRRAALKAAFAGAAASQLTACGSGKEATTKPTDGAVGWSNWSGNQTCSPKQKVRPRSEADLMKFFKESEGTVRAVGASHSFSGLVPTDENLLSLARFRGIKNINTETKEVTIGGGARLSSFGDELWDAGLGMINMPDINTQSLAGSIATSTHGTGKDMGSLSSFVTGMKIVTPQGEVVECRADKNPEIFNAARTNLGALGAATEITLQMRDRYYLKERVEMVGLEEGLERLEEMRDKHRHFEAYGLPHADYMLYITLDEVSEEEAKAFPEKTDNGDAYEAFRTLSKVVDYLPFMKEFIINMGARSVEPEEKVDRWHDTFGNVRDIRFNEMEYTVPAEDGATCFREVLETIKKKDIDVIFPIEYRYIKQDDIWLSMFSEQDGAAISCHNFHDKPYKDYFAEMETIFKKYKGRPHWGKLHSRTGDEFAELYPHWEAFHKVRKELDPEGRMINKHLQRVFGKWA